jgi:DNA-directed RNA polymerase specialized sigma24 family protein
MQSSDKIYSKHKHWIRVVERFGEYRYAEDIVQEAYIKLYGKDINEAYFYFTLRSLTMDLHRKKIEMLPLSKEVEFEISLVDEIDLLELTQPYFDYIDTWDWYDKMLFMLWVDSGVSMREISRRTHIGFMSVYNTIKNCKLKIKQWEEENQKD